MKTKITFLLLLFITVLAYGQKTYVPDDNFEAYLESHHMGDGIDNNDSVYTDSISGVTFLDVHGQNISDLTGIEDFTALDTLYCYSNQLTEIDVSSNTTLKMLWCHNNQLTGLDVSSNTALEWLSCGNNNLAALDVSKNPALKGLYCLNDQLTELDVSSNTALEKLYCNNNQLDSLDVSSNAALKVLWCYNNKLTALDVSKNPALVWLGCNNNQLTYLNLANGNNTYLSRLYAHNNPNLSQICVDDPSNSPPATPGTFWQKDASASYVKCGAATVPVSDWAVVLGLLLMAGYTAIQYKRKMA